MEKFNLDHYIKVREARKELGLNVTNSIDITEGHPLKNRKIFKPIDKFYKIEKIIKEWYRGYFIKLLLLNEQTQSHAVVLWENISCHSMDILDAIERFRNEYKLIEEEKNE